jgi:speckle-type POZ protein
VFAAQLFGPIKEKAEPIKVDDMELSIFKELLHFIYTDSVSDKHHYGDDDHKIVSMQQHLLVAADRYMGWRG